MTAVIVRQEPKRKLLWVGDATIATGFARCTHHTLDVLKESWEVHVLGVNYMGDPHSWPYAIYPCWAGGDGFGVQRMRPLLEKIRPDMVVIQNDPWNIKTYADKIPVDIPVVASMPVDGKNCRGGPLNALAHAIFWTEFGLREAREGGFHGEASVVPLGVELDVYKPLGAREMRQRIGLPEDTLGAFIVGNVNRNQPRKRLDLTVKYFAKWLDAFGHDDAYLFLYVAPTGELSYDVQQLMQYYGYSGKKKRLILLEPDVGRGHPEQVMAQIYSTFDVQVSTTQGEGWGLTTMEGMACGVPQIVPDWSALGEWADGYARLVPCTSTCVTPNRINAIGGVADETAFIEALEELYSQPLLRQRWSMKGLECVTQPQYRWPNIGKRFAEILDAVHARALEQSA